MSKDELHVVFGASGALGSAIIRELRKQDRNVRGVNRSGKIRGTEEVEMAKADIFDPQSSKNAVTGATVIYHCVSPPYTKWPEKHPLIMESMINLAINTGARLVFGDNLYCYGRVQGPIAENLPYNPHGRKGKARAQIADMLIEAHNNGKIEATIGRSSDFFGPRVLFAAIGERVVPNILRGQKVSVLGNLDVPHTYMFIEDFAKGLITLADHNEAFGQVWHIPSAETLTTRQFLELMFEEANAEPKISVTPNIIVSLLGIVDPTLRELKETLYQFQDPFILDHSKFEKAFGKTVTPHREAIHQTLDWYKNL
ncbi:MAG: NAD-dependent epimerase/dehydratase family protein [Candidatus Thorarchaeota archaeon]